MSLKDRQETAETEVANQNKIPDGDFRVRLKDWKFGKSQKGADMYTLTWKFLKVIGFETPDDVDEDFEIKGKERKTRYLPGQNWSITALYTLLEGMGVDLSKYNDVSEIDDILELVEDTKMPKATLTLKFNEKNPKYPDITISDVEEVLGGSDEGEDEGDEGSEPEAAPEPEAKKKKKKKIGSPGK